MSLNISSWCSWGWDASDESRHLSTTVVSVAAVTIITVLWLWCFRITLKKRKLHAGLPLPPGPRRLPIVGHLPFLGTTELHKKFTEWGKVHGPVYKLWLGSKLYVVVGSPSMAKEVVREKDLIFANRIPSIATSIFSYGASDIVFGSYGPQWRKLRKICVQEMLSNSSLDASYELRKEEVRRAIRDVYERSGSAINIGDLAFKTSANTVIRMLCGGSNRGEKWADLVAEFRDLTAEALVLIGKPNVSDFLPVLAGFDFQGIEKQAKRVHQSLERTVTSMIEQCLSSKNKEEAKEGEKRKDVLDILLRFHKLGDADTSITMNQLKATLLDIVVAGTDTTATTIEWTMAELMKHQEVMEKVQKELEEVVGMHNVVEEFHLPKLHYLDAVLKETMRLHSAVPTPPRSPSQSCTLGGYNIPKGAAVVLNVYAIHRDPNLWSNPLEFKPERFQNDNFDYLGNNFQYLPFGSGRRVCAGLALAEKLLMYILASLLHSFDWKLPNGTDLEFSDKFGLVVKKLKPLVVVSSPRLSNYEP